MHVRFWPDSGQLPDDRLWPTCEVAADTEYVRLAVQTGSARASAKTAFLIQMRHRVLSAARPYLHQYCARNATFSQILSRIGVNLILAFGRT